MASSSHHARPSIQSMYSQTVKCPLLDPSPRVSTAQPMMLSAQHPYCEWEGRHVLPLRMQLGLCLLGARGGNAHLPVVLCAPDLLKRLVSCLVSWPELICSVPCDIISCQVILTRACHLALQIPSSVFHMVAQTC